MNSKKELVLKVQQFVIVLIILFLGCKTTVKNPGDKFSLYFSAPPVMNNVNRHMTVPGFWINKLDNPGEIIMTVDEIITWNITTLDNIESMNNIPGYPDEISGDTVLEMMIKDIDDISNNDSLQYIDGSIPLKSFFSDIKDNMDIESIGNEIEVSFGFITGFSDIRAIPSMTLLNYDTGEWDFDVLQYSAADIATPVAILHESRDGKWLYVSEPQYSGWILSDNVVYCSREELRSYLANESFIVITDAKAEIYVDDKYLDYGRMGTRLPLVNISGEFAEVLIPYKNSQNILEFKIAEISVDKVHTGYLEYTRENIIRSAFKILNSPYGWGGMFGEQDCSRFLCQVFGTVGFKLPRNSSKQVLSGIISDISEFTPDEKVEKVTGEALPGITFLGFPGHIMLYLGEHEGEPYAIHSMWAYKEKIGAEDKIRLVNRTVVSDMSPGEGSDKGSFRERLAFYGVFSN